MKSLLNETTISLQVLAKARERLDDSDDGLEGCCGNWELRLGGYDHGYGIYYKGQEIGRVNYEYREYELYHEDFMPKELIPEFLAALDARGFKDVGYHEQEDENFDDDDGPRYVQESIGNLETFLAEKEKKFKPSRTNPSWDESENKIWAVEDYLSMMGGFTDEDREYLRETDPELLSLEENEDDGQDMFSEARKQIMWAINFRNMNTAVHGLFYGKDRRRVEKFAKEIEYIQTASDMEWDEQQYAWESLYEDYPDIATMDEFNYRDIVDLPGGYEGIEDGDTIYRFVNQGTMDIYNESTRKRTMKKIVNEPENDGHYCLIQLLRDMGHSDGWIKKHYLDYGYVVCGDCKFFKPDEKKNDGSGICSKKGDIKGFNSVSICEKFRPTRGTDNMRFSKIVKESDEGYDSDTPKIYVGTYAKYNDGSIDGKWITISDYNTYEEFVDACRELHSDESDPEFMVQDYENFPRRWYHEGGLPSEEEFDKINEFYMMDDDDKEAYEAYVDLDYGDDDIEAFREKYIGKFSSMSDFGYYLVDNFGMPSENIDWYFDYDSFGRDLTMDWHQGDPDEMDDEGEPEDPEYYYDSDGHMEMPYDSDKEVAEQWVDDMGGVEQLGKETIDNYFDYEEFGRIVFDNDCSESNGYVFWSN